MDSTNGFDSVEIPVNRIYSGVERGYLFPDNRPGIVWLGLTDVEEQEEDFRIETYYIDGNVVGRNHIAGTYSATAISYGDPFDGEDLDDLIVGFSYRETFKQNGEDHYRLHMVHQASVQREEIDRSTHNDSLSATKYRYGLYSVDTDLGDGIVGSHLILDSTLVYPYVMRDIEKHLYGSGNSVASMPTIDELYDYFALMNLLIIDHGDGTWSAQGHESMIRMLDIEEFEISTPTAYYHEDDPMAFDIESLIRDERWQE